MNGHSNIEREVMGIMHGGNPGTTLRMACQEFEAFWTKAVKDHPAAKIWNPEIEATVKRIARIAFLEGKGL